MPLLTQQRPPPGKNDGLRLLLIDDDRQLCRLITDYLKPLGYDVSAAHNGVDGLAGFGVDFVSMCLSALHGPLEPFTGFQKRGFAL